MVKSKFLFKIYYIGKKKYYGSQRQRDFLTIEECLLNTLIEKNYINEVNNSDFEFASRTDRYVSARGAYFTCITEKKPILMEINAALPKDIGIWAYTKVPFDFSSRYDALMRHYIYIVPRSLTYFQNISTLNFKIMQQACKKLEGQHDFANFSKKEKDKINTIRDMYSVKLSKQNNFLVFDFKSKSFLRQQIRRIVKKVLELGKGEIIYKDFLDLFDSSKEHSYQPVDANGLILWDIKYDDTIELEIDPKSKERMNNFFLKKEIYFNFKHQLFRTLQQHDFS
ncbi:MAG: tRNA pseudouridine(38-40) synthase TruA [Promethearchaeota archaeon]|nr:MAG: tRNA pseudouridine(38-40) synthase TruA [Candidatus Lokiarchaeota archaeon]